MAEGKKYFVPYQRKLLSCKMKNRRKSQEAKHHLGLTTIERIILMLYAKRARIWELRKL